MPGDAAARGLQPLAQRGFVAQDAAGEALDLAAESGGLGRGRFAVEQPHAELVLEQPERLADGLLGAAEMRCGTAEPAVVEHREEVAQLLHPHVPQDNLGL